MSDYFRNSVIKNTSRAEANVDQGLRGYLLRVYNYMSLGLALTGVVAMATASSPTLMNSIYNSSLKWVIVFAPIGMVFFLFARINSMKASTAQLWFWSYAGITGLSMSYLFLAYTGASIAKVFFIASGTFAATSLYGYVTKADLSRFGSFLLMGIIGVAVASLTNLFVHSSGFDFAISLAGVALFIGFTAYDTQRIKNLYYMSVDEETGTKMAIVSALSLYMNFINLFVYLLRLMGDRR